MNRILNRFAVGAVLCGVTLGGCGGGAQPPSSEKVNAAISASARELDTENQNEQNHDRMVSRFMTVLNQLRALPALAPLFDQYQVPDPIVIGDDDLSAGLIDLLHAVRITVVSGTVTITNRETRAEIFSGPLSDLASGVFHPENLPGGTPSACTYAYSEWGACQPTSTQFRTVVSATPAGCTGTPVLTQACTYTAPPPLPVTSCTGFTYSAWGTCQSDGTQTRTVLTSSPSGCTGGTPTLTQSCVYTAPIDGAALYGQYCAGCHGALATSNLKGKNMSVSSIQSRNMTQGLTDAQLQAIVTAVGP